MRRTLLALLSAALLFGLAGAARAADDEAKAILAKAVKAHGGEETLEKHKAGQAKNKGKINLPGVGEVSFTQELAYMLPDKFKESLEMEIGGQKINVVTLVNGDKTTIEANGQAVPLTDEIKKALEDGRYMMKTARLGSLAKDKNVELSSLGEVKVNDKPAVGLLVKSKGHKDISLFFDKETGRLAKVEHRTVEAQSGKEITEERIILEYGKDDKSGIPVPKRILVKHDGDKFMEAEVLEAKFLEKLDDSEFKK
jgi:hypothetical protein